jgi:hypothetical protein
MNPPPPYNNILLSVVTRNFFNSESFYLYCPCSALVFTLVPPMPLYPFPVLPHSFTFMPFCLFPLIEFPLTTVPVDTFLL